MKTKILIIILSATCVVIGSVGCGEMQSNESIPEMPTSFNDYDFSLVEIASDISFIPISSQEIMEPIYEIKYFDPYFLIKTRGQKLYRIWKDGRLFDVLDKFGRGPDEYMAISNFHVNRNGDIIINTAREKRLRIYNDSLDFESSIPYPKDVEDSDIRWINDTPYLFTLPIGKPSKYDWVSMDMEGNIIDSVVYDGQGVTIYQSSEGSLQVFGSSNVRYRYRQTSDTIYEIGENGYQPVYSINRFFDDGLRMSSIDEVTSHPKTLAELNELFSLEGKRDIYRIFDLGLNWIIQYRSEDSETVLLNRRENKSYLIRTKSSMPKLFNDFVGAGDIRISGTIEVDHEKYIISYMDAYEFITLVSSDSFIKGKPVMPEKKKEMQGIAARLTEDDNPILILLKLK